MLQQEKNIRTQVEALMKEKTSRMQQLKVLLEQDQDLCDILCSMPYGIAPDSVPTPEQLENFREHINNQNAEKVGAHFDSFESHLLNHLDINNWTGYKSFTWNWKDVFLPGLFRVAQTHIFTCFILVEYKPISNI